MSNTKKVDLMERYSSILESRNAYEKLCAELASQVKLLKEEKQEGEKRAVNSFDDFRFKTQEMQNILLEIIRWQCNPDTARQPFRGITKGDEEIIRIDGAPNRPIHL